MNAIETQVQRLWNKVKKKMIIYRHHEILHFFAFFWLTIFTKGSIENIITMTRRYDIRSSAFRQPRESGNDTHCGKGTMNDDIIRQIKAAEDQAYQKIQDARAQAEALLHAARHQAVEDHAEIVDMAHKNARTHFEQGVKAFESAVENVRQQFQKEIALDVARSTERFEQVVTSVACQFQQRVGENT